MHKLGVQVMPSPDMMAIMDAKDTLCKETLLSMRSEDMLTDYTADEFATGFKKRPIFQLRGIKQNRGSSCEKRQPGSSCPSPVVMVFMGSKDMLCRVAILNTGWEDKLAPFTIKEFATGFKKSLAFQPHGHQTEQRLVTRGHLDQRQPGRSYTSPDVMVFMGSKDMLCKDTLAHFTVAAGFKKTPAFQLRGIKQSKGSSGEGIWITTRVGGHARIRR
ncbi:HERC1 [Symbiodinium sp. CCMP2592]|nr:HERC1 [Symbiodinium sp. CCMP2592]